MVERRNPPDAIHFIKENENAIASKLGGLPTPPASTASASEAERATDPPVPENRLSLGG